MHRFVARIRSAAVRRVTRRGPDPLALPPNCSWEAMRQVYEEQAARGVPEAVKGLEYIEQDRWPTTGRPRDS